MKRSLCIMALLLGGAALPGMAAADDVFDRIDRYVDGYQRGFDFDDDRRWRDHWHRSDRWEGRHDRDDDDDDDDDDDWGDDDDDDDDD